MIDRITPLLLYIGLVWGQDDPNPERFEKSPQGDRASIGSFIQWDKKNSVPQDPIVFVGSSSIRKWPTAEYFPDLPIINRGFGGSHISDVNYYVYETVLKYKPKIIVFYAGDNDIAGGKSPEQVLNDYKRFIGLIHSNLSNTQVIFIPIKPSLRRWTLWPEMRKTNKLIHTYSNQHPLLHYVDTATPMLGNDSVPRSSLFVNDSLHLSIEGYDLWSELLGTVFKNVSR